MHSVPSNNISLPKFCTVSHLGKVNLPLVFVDITSTYLLLQVRSQLLSWVAEHRGPKSKVFRGALDDAETALENFFEELRLSGIWEKVREREYVPVYVMQLNAQNL